MIDCQFSPRVDSIFFWIVFYYLTGLCFYMEWVTTGWLSDKGKKLGEHVVEACRCAWPAGREMLDGTPWSSPCMPDPTLTSMQTPRSRKQPQDSAVCPWFILPLIGPQHLSDRKSPISHFHFTSLWNQWIEGYFILVFGICAQISTPCGCDILSVLLFPSYVFPSCRNLLQM